MSCGEGLAADCAHRHLIYSKHFIDIISNGKTDSLAEFGVPKVSHKELFDSGSGFLGCQVAPDRSHGHRASGFRECVESFANRLLPVAPDRALTLRSAELVEGDTLQRHRRFDLARFMLTVDLYPPQTSTTHTAECIGPFVRIALHVSRPSSHGERSYVSGHVIEASLRSRLIFRWPLRRYFSGGRS
jgi:hypothetical protein